MHRVLLDMAQEPGCGTETSSFPTAPAALATRFKGTGAPRRALQDQQPQVHDGKMTYNSGLTKGRRQPPDLCEDLVKGGFETPPILKGTRFSSKVRYFTHRVPSYARARMYIV